MIDKAKQRYDRVLRYVQENPCVTARLLRIALPLTPKEIQQTLGLLSRREYVLRGAARGHHTYTITALGEAWLHVLGLSPDDGSRLF